MIIENNFIGRKFFALAIILLCVGLTAGLFSSFTYIFPDFLIGNGGLSKLRPMHVSGVMFWIIIGAIGCVFTAMSSLSSISLNKTIAKMQYALWLIALVGVFYSYLTNDFGGREYWEFNPIWAFPIALSWILFLVNFIIMLKGIKKWPVYVWMWMTGIVFFLLIFIENYLWLFPHFREDFVTDMTIQWKVNGSIVGTINQMIYGTAFYLMDRINKVDSTKVGSSKLAFAMYFLGLTNLMFNWGHHIYTLPTEQYVRYVAYFISMTEWVFFVKIIYDWRKSLVNIKANYHYFPFRFLMASDFWVFVNIGQAVLMSIPVFNIYTHGTHVTVAHSMGTTIGINSMILFAALFMFLTPKNVRYHQPNKRLNFVFWTIQIALFIFFISLDIAGLIRGFWQLNPNQGTFAEMMKSIIPFFIIVSITGFILIICFFYLAATLFKYLIISKHENKYRSE